MDPRRTQPYCNCGESPTSGSLRILLRLSRLVGGLARNVLTKYNQDPDTSVRACFAEERSTEEICSLWSSLCGVDPFDRQIR